MVPGKPIEPRTLSGKFKKAAMECGIENCHFHILRHTFATKCVEAGINIQVLSEILGHTSVKITMDRYVHLSMEYKQAQLCALNLPIPIDISRQNSGQE